MSKMSKKAKAEAYDDLVERAALLETAVCLMAQGGPIIKDVWHAEDGGVYAHEWLGACRVDEGVIVWTYSTPGQKPSVHVWSPEQFREARRNVNLLRWDECMQARCWDRLTEKAREAQMLAWGTES